MSRKECPFTLNEDGKWECPHCKWVYPRKSKTRPHSYCKMQDAEPLDQVCDFKPTGKTSPNWQCVQCGWEYTGPTPPRRNCPNADPAKIASGIDPHGCRKRCREIRPAP